MQCSEPKCLASLSWFGGDDDPAMVELATQRGWRLFEGGGWVCPTHIEERRANPTPTGAST